MTEEQRLAELRSLQLLDSGYEKEFNDIVELASQICETPVSLITLLDADRQWFKAKKGTEIEQTDRSVSFCAHTIQQPDSMIVPDLSKDPRFAENVLVKNDPHVRFYAGSAIVGPDGAKLGTLCVLDTKPRELTPKQQHTLEVLAQQVSRLIELRKLRMKP